MSNAKQHAAEIVRTLREHGHQAYLAGGCVRDLLLSREPADYDVATDATPQQVMQIFPQTYAVGEQFGVVLVPDSDGATGALARPGERNNATVEIAAMKGVQQPPQYHPEGDVFVHTLLLLEKLQPSASGSVSGSVSKTLAWGALLHDVGKPATFRIAPDRIRFDGHVEVGVKMAEEICGRLRFSNDDAAQILALIGNHMRFAQAQQMKESTLKKFMRMAR